MPFIEFADFNRDGMTDMAFMSETGTLTVLSNKLSAPGPKATNLCNDVGNTSILKTSNIFPAFPFEASQEGVVQQNIGTWKDKTIVYSGITDSLPSASNEPAVPGRLRVADIDLDGYPDITMTLNF